MITDKPKNFHMVYESGVSCEFANPATGIAFYKANWAALQAGMQYLAERANESVTLIDTDTDDSITVDPYGKWR